MAYRANTTHPIFLELQSIVRKTCGLPAQIKAGLTPHAEQIRFAALYGSVAKGSNHARSDVDLLIVGDISLEQALAAVVPVESRIGREPVSAEESGVRSPEGRNRVAAASTSRNAMQCRLGAGTEGMTGSDLLGTKNTLILDRCSNPLQREFYLRATARFGWTRRVLEHQIDNQTYEKYLLNQTSFDNALPQAIAAQAKLAVKDHYTVPDSVCRGRPFGGRQAPTFQPVTMRLPSWNGGKYEID